MQKLEFMGVLCCFSNFNFIFDQLHSLVQGCEGRINDFTQFLVLDLQGILFPFDATDLVILFLDR